jgi:hypothetical protein
MKDRGKVVPVLVAFLLAAAPGTVGVAGCGPARVPIRSKVALENTRPFGRLLVLAKLKDTFHDPMLHEFEMNLSHVLAKCGVRSRILHVGSRDMIQPRVEEAMVDFGPEAFLEIEPTGGSSYAYSDRVEHEIIFQLQLVDLESRAQIWLARAQLRAASTDDAAAGSAFASTIVSQLRDDGVLKGCPGDARP